jgi:hypothetical protein
MIARYLASHAETLAYATLCRRLAAIHSAHVVVHAKSRQNGLSTRYAERAFAERCGFSSDA